MDIRGWLTKGLLRDLPGEIKHVTQRLSEVSDPAKRRRLERYREELQHLLKAKKAEADAKRLLQEVEKVGEDE